MTGGFQPLAPGSKLTLTGTEASYISITLTNVQLNTQFQNFSVELQGLEFTNTSNAWGATSLAGFTNWSAPTLSNNGTRLTLNLPDFTWTTPGPLEIRLYGLTGVGEGAFTDVKVSSSFLAVIPEPGIPVLLGTGLALSIGFGRRRR